MQTNVIPKKNIVLYFAKTSSAFDTLTEIICITTNIVIVKIANSSTEAFPVANIIIANQNEAPADTLKALNRGEDNFILYRIHKYYYSTL